MTLKKAFQISLVILLIMFVTVTTIAGTNTNNAVHSGTESDIRPTINTLNPEAPAIHIACSEGSSCGACGGANGGGGNCPT